MSKRLAVALAMSGLLLAGCGPKPAAESAKKEVVGQWVFDVEATVNEYPENPLTAAYNAVTSEQQAQMRELAAAKPFMEFFDDGRAVMAIGQGGGAGIKGQWSWSGSAYIVKLEQKGDDPSFTYRDGKLSGGGNPQSMAVFTKLATASPATSP